MDYNKVKNFMNTHFEWIKMGRPVRTPEKIVELYNICSSCEHFQKDRCMECGCYIKKHGIIMNKLALANTRCPLDEPKWIEEPGFEPKELPTEIPIDEKSSIKDQKIIVPCNVCGKNKKKD